MFTTPRHPKIAAVLILTHSPLFALFYISFTQTRRVVAVHDKLKVTTLAGHDHR
jgi:hypothetical protein